jgi:hypothetical protein
MPLVKWYTHPSIVKIKVLSGLNCGKFFHIKIKGSLNDGGFTVFDYVDVEIHDL